MVEFTKRQPHILALWRTVVKIKAAKYGRAIRMLLERGGTFQTRHQYTLIVNSTQRKILEDANLLELNGSTEGMDGKHATKKDPR